MKLYRLTTDGISVSALINSRVDQLINNLDQSCAADVFALCFDHVPVYLQNTQPIPLIVLVYIALKNKVPTIQAALLPDTAEHENTLRAINPDLSWLQTYAATYQSPWLNLSAPLLLQPVYIPKPWGQEIWYTGIEARGQSRVSEGRFSIPLPWVLELLPKEEPITLLKILDPLPDANLGNLYFELHEQKQEVYIVTHIDPQAWPEGVGQIQMGFCQQKRNQYASAAEFKQAYLQAVADYRDVRKTIDDSLDSLSQELIQREQNLRNVMNEFIYHHPLRIGDVVKVPCFTPHSLQHGVRVVEFQTPVYERKILSFGQKVLTQQDWDTEDAMAIAHVDAVQLEVPELIFSSAAYRLERIVNFDGFEVQRLMTEQAVEIPLNVNANTLVMLVKGSACFLPASGSQIRGQVISPGEAYLVNTMTEGKNLTLEAGSILLIALPNQRGWSDLG